VGQPHIAGDDRALADGDPAQNGRAGIDHHVVLDDRMARVVLHQGAVLVDLEPLGPQGDRLVEPHAAADDRRLADSAFVDAL